MSKQEEANLILKLYELRRDPTMRQARQWYIFSFHPRTLEEFNAALYGDCSAHLRMVVSYWEMAAALVNNGAIDLQMFHECNGEHLAIFAKIEPLLEQIRASYTPRYAEALEKLVDATPDGRKQVAGIRAQMKTILDGLAAKQASAGDSK